MGVLLIILACLFAALALAVFFTERRGSTMTAEQQQTLSKIIIVLVGVLLVAGVLQNYFK